MKLSMNLLFPFFVGFTLWLGFTGRVDWWTISLVIAAKLDFIATWSKK